MDNINDPRPPLSEWILGAYDVLCMHSLSSDDHEEVQSIPREQALDILCSAAELALDSEDANYALTWLPKCGFFYEVDGEFRETMPED